MRKKVMVGNVSIYPDVLRRMLKKSTYYLTYCEKTDEARFSTDGSDGDIFVLKNIPYESAKRLAEELGLSILGGNEIGSPHHWMKHIPSVTLRHDGSVDADALLLEIVKLGLPYKLELDSTEIALIDCGTLYRSGGWTHEKMLEKVRKLATQYRAQLDTAP